MTTDSEPQPPRSLRRLSTRSGQPVYSLSILAIVWCALFGWALLLDGDFTLWPPPRASVTALTMLGALRLPLSQTSDLWHAATAPLLHVDALHLGGSLSTLIVIAATWPFPRGRSLWGALAWCAAASVLGSIATYRADPVLCVGPSGALCGALSAACCARAAIGERLLWAALLATFLLAGWRWHGDQAAHVSGLCAGCLWGLRLRLAAARQGT